MLLFVVSLLTFLLTLYYVLGILFLRNGWGKLYGIQKDSRMPTTKVSVLIAARNEEENIGRTLEAVLAQHYPKELLEIIVVDDHSTDRTPERVGSYAKDGVILIKLVEDQPINSYKKKAISMAVKAARGELMITTDADCSMGPDWISTIVSFYENGNWKLIASPVAYFEEKTHFEKMQALEFLYLIGLGAASIGNKVPATCNGANLAYPKAVFEALKGFEGIDDLASGDDELFLHKVAAKYPDGVGFCKAREAVVYTYAKANLKEFIRQRKRWASKSVRYKNKGLVALGVFIWLFNLLIILNMLLGFFDPAYWRLVLIVLLSKFVAEIFFLIRITRFINRTKLLRYLPVLTILHVFYMVYIGIAGNSGKYVWKDRVVQ